MIHLILFFSYCTIRQSMLCPLKHSICPFTIFTLAGPVSKLFPLHSSALKGISIQKFVMHEPCLKRKSYINKTSHNGSYFYGNSVGIAIFKPVHQPASKSSPVDSDLNSVPGPRCPLLSSSPSVWLVRG